MPARTLSLLLLLALAAGCAQGGDTAPSDDDGDGGAQATASADPVGQCAVDARDGAPYGRIASAETDAESGVSMYRIEAEGGTVWTKNAANVRVVECE
jgi:hypothetical protein